MVAEKIKRKRKISDIASDNPPKLVKTEEENADISDNSVEEENVAIEDERIKFPKDFKMSHFRKRLKTNQFITELRHFLYLAEKNPRMVMKYIEKKGKPLELAEAMERIDKSHLFHIGYICQALHLVLMEILTNQKEHTESAIAASRYFLKSHGQVIEKLLKSPNSNHRKCVLKLLTAIVCLEPQLGRQLLTNFDVISNVKSMEQLLSHSKFETNPSDSVRKAYIHFILAYLVDGNILLIKNILDKYDLINSLLHGLEFDDHITVSVVLNTLKKYVLESPSFTKTKKIHVFDSNVVKSIAKLFNWKGPKYFSHMFNNKKGEDLQLLIDSDEKEAVAKVTSEFLTVLLTSRKHGIAFDAMANLKQRKNVITAKSLGLLEKPWTSVLKSDLIVNILTSCPELAKESIKKYSIYLSQRRHENVCEVIAFLDKLINAMHPNVMRSGLDQIGLVDFTFWIKGICLCPEVLIYLKGTNTLRNQKYELRIASVKILLTMFRQYCNYMNSIIEREKFKGNDLRKFKFDMIDHIFVNFPTVESILLSLYESIQHQADETVDVLEHLEYTLDLVLIICKANRSFVDKTGSVINYIQLLRPLYESQKSDSGNVRIELKAIKLILALTPNALKPGARLFAEVVESFFNIFINGSGGTQKEAGNLLKGILLNTGLFENNHLEVALWIEALRFIKAEHISETREILIKSLKSLKISKLAIQRENTDHNERTGSLKDLFLNIENNITVQGYIEIPTASKFFFYIINESRNASEEVGNYLEIVSLLLFHYLPSPQTIQRVYAERFSQFNKYMAHWMDKGKPEMLKIQSIPLLADLSKFLLKGDSFSMEEAFKSLENDSMAMIYIYYTIFVVCQLASNSKLEENHVKTATELLKNLFATMQASKKKDDEKFELILESDRSDPAKSSLEHIVRYIYCSHVYLLKNFNILGTNESDQNLVKFIFAITKTAYDLKLENFDEITLHYRRKIINQLQSAISDANLNLLPVEVSKIVSILQAFQLTVADCVELLKNFSELPLQTLLNGNHRSVCFEILIHTLNRLAELKKSINDEEIITKLSSIYCGLIKENLLDPNFENFEESLHNFFTVSHHLINKIPAQVFSAIFEATKLNKSTVKICVLLLDRRSDLEMTFLKLLEKNYNRREIIYPLLKIAIRKEISIELKLVNSIYQEYKNGFIKTIEKPQKAGAIYKENSEVSTFLIKVCMPASECFDFCKKSLKMDAIESFQVKLVAAIYEKAMESNQDKADARQLIFVNFLNILLQMFSIVLKKESIGHEKIALLSFTAFKWIRTHGKENTYDFEKILSSQMWQSFCKNCLKLGMKVAEPSDSDIEELNSQLLKILAFLADVLYEDDSNDNNVAGFFEMVTTHSRFFDILLSERKYPVKTEVLHLLLVLAKKSPQVINEKHVPVLLGAYHAKLSNADRYVLALLQFYESNGINLHQFRPFIWGESAIAHYSLKEQEEKTVLPQAPTVMQVMALIDRQVSDYTISNFPQWRKLNTLKQLPAISFVNPSSPLVHGTNSVERNIERGSADFPEETQLNICPRKDGTFEECYDPAFVIPLMIMCFAPENYTQPVRVVQNGLLAITFTALSSQDKEMRMATGCAQLRYRQHFEANKFLDKPIWIQAYDNIQKGLEALRTDSLKHQKSGVPRAPLVSCLFLARTVNLLLDPLDPLYKVLTMYLRVKNTFNFLCVPEFNVLFHNPDVEHHKFRQFVLEVIRDGIKCNSDLTVLVATNIFKALLGFYSSPMSTLDNNLLILSIVSICTKIPASAKIMLDAVGILPWLNSVISPIEYYHFDTIEGVISILNNLWYAIQANNKDFLHVRQINDRLFYLLVKLSPNISNRISLSSFLKFVNILNKTAGDNQKLLPESSLDRIISCGKNHFEHEIWYVENIKDFGKLGAERSDDCAKRLLSLGVEKDAVFILNSLRDFVIKWVS